MNATQSELRMIDPAVFDPSAISDEIRAQNAEIVAKLAALPDPMSVPPALVRERRRQGLLAQITERQRRIAALELEINRYEAQNLLELEQRRARELWWRPPTKWPRKPSTVAGRQSGTRRAHLRHSPRGVAVRRRPAPRRARRARIAHRWHVVRTCAVVDLGPGAFVPLPRHPRAPPSWQPPRHEGAFPRRTPGGRAKYQGAPASARDAGPTASRAAPALGSHRRPRAPASQRRRCRPQLGAAAITALSGARRSGGW